MENKDKRFYLKVQGKEVEVSEEIYREYIRPIRAEQRRKRREWKCQVMGKKGNLVRCNKDCRECPYALSGHNALGNKLSLDRMKDEGVDIEDRRQDVEQNYIDEEEKRELYAAIAKLTPRQKELVRLIYFEEKSQEEVAAMLGISQCTISLTLKKAAETLKKILEN